MLKDDLIAALKLAPTDRKSIEAVAATLLQGRTYSEFIRWLDMPGNEDHLRKVVNGN